jgi:hypothetical protein
MRQIRIRLQAIQCFFQLPVSSEGLIIRLTDNVEPAHRDSHRARVSDKIPDQLIGLTALEVRSRHFDCREPRVTKNPNAFLQRVVFKRDRTSSHRSDP